VNGDGKLDLLVGDTVSLISPAKDLSDEEFKEKFEAWQKAVEDAQKALISDAADEEARNKASQEFSKLYQKRSEFMQEERTGFVWLYVQK
jgi:hypothetical protein